MKKEDYVSLGVAQILKEKGYDERCRAFYENDEYVVGMLPLDYNKFPSRCSMPTLYEAQKWLRIKHRVSITPYYVGNDKYTYHLVRMNGAYNYCNNNNIYDTYEEALNEGIKEALELV